MTPLIGILIGLTLAALFIAALLHNRNMHLEELLRQTAGIAEDIFLDPEEEGARLIETDEAVLMHALREPFSRTAYGLINASAGTAYLEILEQAGDNYVVCVTKPNGEGVLVEERKTRSVSSVVEHSPVQG